MITKLYSDGIPSRSEVSSIRSLLVNGLTVLVPIGSDSATIYNATISLLQELYLFDVKVAVIEVDTGDTWDFDKAQKVVNEPLKMLGVVKSNELTQNYPSQQITQLWALVHHCSYEFNTVVIFDRIPMNIKLGIPEVITFYVDSGSKQLQDVTQYLHSQMLLLESKPIVGTEQEFNWPGITVNVCTANLEVLHQEPSIQNPLNLAVRRVLDHGG